MLIVHLGSVQWKTKATPWWSQNGAVVQRAYREQGGALGWGFSTQIEQKQRNLNPERNSISVFSRKKEKTKSTVSVSFAVTPFSSQPIVRFIQQIVWFRHTSPATLLRQTNSPWVDAEPHGTTTAARPSELNSKAKTSAKKLRKETGTKENILLQWHSNFYTLLQVLKRQKR